MDAYDRIARVIRYLDAHRTEQPDLTRLARQSGLSASHFHRLFSAWAGVTPKDFLQTLTLADAAARLRAGNSVLEAAHASGLSGPGRLHDLCVGLEAASPGELKTGGEGLTIRAGFAGSPFGRCLVAEGPRGVCHLGFTDDQADAVALASLAMAWPRARRLRDDDHAASLAARIFASPDGESAGRPLRAFVRGTEFQVRVWRALLRVPPGALVSYRALAMAVGRPAAARAVGTAVGRNTIACLIPCHRVIRETGLIGGYRWGETRKHAILAREGSMRDSDPENVAGRPEKARISD